MTHKGKQFNGKVKYILVLFYIGCFLKDVCAQTASSFTFSDVQYHYFLGKIVKHTNDFKPKITENTQCHELSFNFKTNGEKAWHQTHDKPNLNFNLIYVQYGDAQIFGESFNMLTGLQYNKHHRRFVRQLNLKFGLNYSTKPYNFFTNPINNAIGSHFNLTAKVDFGYAYKLTNKLYLSMRLSIKHHSNGRVETPNKGVNVMGGQIGLQWKVNQPNYKNQTDEKPFNSFYKKHQLVFSVGYGRHEFVKEFNGPKYPVYVAGFFAQKRLNALLMLNYGIEYVYFKSAYTVIIDNAIVPNRPHWHAGKISPYIGLDVLYGRFAISFLIGYYPYKPILTAGRIPTKFGFKYYLHSNDAKHMHNVFIAGYLKTHYAAAEYLEIAIGWRFGIKQAQ